MLTNVRTEYRDGEVWLVADSSDMSEQDLEKFRSVAVVFVDRILEAHLEQVDREVIGAVPGRLERAVARRVGGGGAVDTTCS